MRIIILSFMFLSFLSYSVFAQESQSSATQYRYYSTSEMIHTGWAPYIGADLGYTGYNPHLDVEGVPSSIKLIGSFVTSGTEGVFDFGFGVQTHNFSQKSAPDSGISSSVFEIAGRYQFANQWQLGAVYDRFFNKGENFSANQSDALFGGVQLVKEFGFAKNYLGRLGGRLMTSLNVNNESVNMILLDFQMGWGGQRSAAISSADRLTN